jgi:hypothetical protein
VDGREVEDVEAEVLHVGKAPDDVVEGAVAIGVARLRARKQLVPGGEAGGETVGDHLEHAIVARQIGAFRVAADELFVLLVQEQRELHLGALLLGLEAAHEIRQRCRVLPGGMRGRFLGDLDALHGLGPHLLAGGEFLADLVEP